MRAFWSIISSSSVSNPLYDGIIALWKLDGNAIDSTGNEFHGLIDGTVTFQQGKLSSQAAFFDGALDSVTITDTIDDNLSFVSGGNDLPFSVEAWIYPTSSGLNVILSKGGLGRREYSFFKESNNKISFFISNQAGTNYLYATSSSSVTLNQWSFVNASYDGSETFAGIKIWINGVQQALTNSSAGSYTGMVAGLGDLTIGNLVYNNALYFNGRINYCALYNKEITQQEVNQRYNSGNGVTFTQPGNVINFDYYTSPYKILYHRDNYIFASDVTTGGTNLKFSSNGGTGWTDYNWGTQWSSGVVYDKTVDFAYIFADGTILFSCGNLLYRSTDGLATAPTLVTPKLMDGSPFPVHTPANPAYPGNYYQCAYLDYQINYVNGVEILVWSNYCNVILNNMGVAPTTVWYTIDKGQTVKALYRFGQNTTYRDNGTPGGSAVSGTILGDSSNATITRHAHGTYRRTNTLEWFTVTGDNDNETHWIKHTYDPQNDTWTNEKISGITTNSAWQNAGLFFVNTEVFWGQDSPVGTNKGIYKASISDIGSSYTRLGNVYEETYGLRIANSGNMVLLNFDSGFNNIATFIRGLTVTRTRNFPFSNTSRILLFIGGDAINGYYPIADGTLWTQPQRTIYLKIY